MGDRRQDHFARKAKKEGRPARSVYKLQEIDEKWRILAPGQRVLDLGASPGSWTQYAAEKVGAKGCVIAYDLKALNVAVPAQVQFEIGDVFDLGRPEGPLTQASSLGTFDVVLSDMAPNTMGHQKTDALRSMALCEQALLIARSMGRTGSALVVKALEGGEVPQLALEMRKTYKKVTRLRPQATRKESTEIFLIGLDKLKAPGDE
jgi:23S rRNA (uridine2552-2'-O)-methyltransferase